jgi:pyridoxal phosphate enzyme (YggS family)
VDRAEEIRANVESVRERISAACAGVGRDPSTVRLVGVTKWKPAADVAAAVRAGLLDLGENYAQELAAKAPEVAALAGVAPRWHFLGGLQTNKVRQVLPIVAGIQSVDRPSLVDEIGKRLAPGATLEVFLEINVGDEAQKSGCAPADAADLARRVLAVPGLRLAGLMCVPPVEDDAEASRPYFRALRDLRDRLRAALAAPPGVLEGLSMGMSHDFHVAVEEGATTVRVGTALFGARTGRP